MKRANVICVMGVVLLVGCHPEPPPPVAPGAAAPVVVRVATAEKKTHVASEDVVGTVRSKLHAVIEAKVSGRIEEMRIAPGDAVKTGELLIQLDSRETQARLEQALAQREQLQRDTERLRSLLGQNAVSRQEFETVESRYRVAVATASEAETMLGYARIEAPFCGVITRKFADVGDLAAPGRPLVEIHDPTALRLEAEVPESLIGRVQPGAKLQVRVSPGDPDKTAIVSEISPTGNPVSRTFTVKLDLPEDRGLRAGQFARVAVPVGEREGIWLPKSAVTVRGQIELVFVVSADKALLRLVKTGKQTGDTIEIVSGVTTGERVATEGARQLKDGQRVEVRP